MAQRILVVKVIPDPEGPGALMFGVPPLWPIQHRWTLLSRTFLIGYGNIFTFTQGWQLDNATKKLRFQSVLFTHRGVLIRVHSHPEREKVATMTLTEKHSIEGMKHTHKQRDKRIQTALRYAHEGQHGHGASSTDPDREEDDQEGGWKHHLTGVSRCVSDRKSKGHRPTQTWRRRATRQCENEKRYVWESVPFFYLLTQETPQSMFNFMLLLLGSFFLTAAHLLANSSSKKKCADVGVFSSQGWWCRHLLP